MQNKEVVVNDDFGIILICAVRYALGRQSYMPSLVQGYVAPLLPELSDRCLGILERDIADAENYGGYGDETIDKPGWMAFLDAIRKERGARCLKT